MSLMSKLLIASLCLALATALPLFADDTDPEPTKTTSTAKSGDYTVKIEKNGIVTGSKKGQLAWQAQISGVGENGQLVIVGEKVVAAWDGIQAVLDLNSGGAYWSRNGGLAKAKMTVNGDRITLTAGKSREVIDLATGKVLESVQGK